jgi:hypothetical protein
MGNEVDSIQLDREIEEMCTLITGIFGETFTGLVARRDAAYKAAIVLLDSEKENLMREQGTIEATAGNLRELLPARARQALREADRLTLEGKHEEAASKLEEMRTAESAPHAMQQRQTDIAARIAAIDAEKRRLAKMIFQTWHAECRRVVRACENGFFLTLLDGLKESFFEFQARTDTGMDAVGRGGLFNISHVANLTSDERSVEWQGGQRWYRGRV